MKQNMRQQIIALQINTNMKISDIITETTAGAVATVAMPMGKMHKRNPSVFPKKKKKVAEVDDYEMTTCDYCNGSEWDPDGPQDDDNYDDCPKCAGTGEIPKDALGGSLTSEDIEVMRKLAGLPEGKSPHKKGTKKYKKHMAAMHAGMGK